MRGFPPWTEPDQRARPRRGTRQAGGNARRRAPRGSRQAPRARRANRARERLRPGRRGQLRRVRRARDRRAAHAPLGRGADRDAPRPTGSSAAPRASTPLSTAPSAAACAVLSYDYTVLAGTQGATGHRKKDRLFELIERMRIPAVIFCEGGGGRPGDTDYAVVSALDTRAFALWGRLSGVVPRIAVVSGRCFAGNAVLAGSSDLIVATDSTALGMGGPAMIEGGGLGTFEPDAIGPIGVQSPNGVVDVRVADEAEAVDGREAARLLLPGPARRLVRAQTPTPSATSCPSAAAAHTTSTPQSTESPTPARSPTFATEFARPMVTALARIEGRAVGIVANNPIHLAGAITSDGADKAARFMSLCDAFGLPDPLADRHAGNDGRPRRRGDRRSSATARASSRSAPRFSVPLCRRDPAQGVRPGRAGDGRRLHARAAPHRRLAHRRAGRHGPRGRREARLPPRARGDRGRERSAPSAWSRWSPTLTTTRRP